MILASLLNIWPDMEQRTEQWFHARAGRPTASQFSRIISPTGKTNDQTWKVYSCELMAEAAKPSSINPTFYGNRHTDRGERLEPAAISSWEDDFGMEIRDTGFVTGESGFCGCSPDGLIYNDEDTHVLAGFEAKAPEEKKHVLYHVNDELPPIYKPQVHGSMVVTGLRNWYFRSYCEDLKPFDVLVEWDDYTEQVKTALEQFEAYHVEMIKRHGQKFRMGVPA